MNRVTVALDQEPRLRFLVSTDAGINLTNALTSPETIEIAYPIDGKSVGLFPKHIAQLPPVQYRRIVLEDVVYEGHSGGFRTYSGRIVGVSPVLG